MGGHLESCVHECFGIPCNIFESSRDTFTSKFIVICYGPHASSIQHSLPALWLRSHLHPATIRKIRSQSGDSRTRSTKTRITVRTIWRLRTREIQHMAVVRRPRQTQARIRVPQQCLPYQKVKLMRREHQWRPKQIREAEL